MTFEDVMISKRPQPPPYRLLGIGHIQRESGGFDPVIIWYREKNRTVAGSYPVDLVMKRHWTAGSQVFGLNDVFGSLLIENTDINDGKPYQNW